MHDILSSTFYHNPLSTWLLALAIVAVVAGSFMLARAFVLRRLEHFAKRTHTMADDVVLELLKRARFVTIVWITLEVVRRTLALPDGARETLSDLALIAFLLQVAIWAGALIAVWVERYTADRAATDATTITTIRAGAIIARILAWSMIFLFALHNLGFNISALIAGLGITGIAVALAVQNILGDLLGALAIVVDKPFVIGDFIVVDTFMGTVEHIGLKTTRVRSLSGEQIIFSNADLLKSRIRNFKRMYERRVLFTIGVVYGTPPDKLARIPAIIREAVEAQQHTRFDRSHFFRYGDSSLDFETVYYVATPDYNVYMDVHQAINLTLLRRFAHEGIDFAFPTRTVILAVPGDEPGPGGGGHAEPVASLRA